MLSLRPTRLKPFLLASLSLLASATAFAEGTPSVTGSWSLCTAGAGRFFGMLPTPIASQLTTYEFGAQTVTVTVRSFSARECHGSALFDYTKAAPYKLGLPNVKFSGATDIATDFTASAQITVHDETTARFLTFQQLCKIATWSTQAPVVSNFACDAKFFNELAMSDLFEIRGAKLYFGSSHDQNELGQKPRLAGVITNFAYGLRTAPVSPQALSQR